MLASRAPAHQCTAAKRENSHAGSSAAAPQSAPKGARSQCAFAARVTLAAYELKVPFVDAEASCERGMASRTPRQPCWGSTSMKGSTRCSSVADSALQHLQLR